MMIHRTPTGMKDNAQNTEFVPSGMKVLQWNHDAATADLPLSKRSLVPAISSGGGVPIDDFIANDFILPNILRTDPFISLANDLLLLLSERLQLLRLLSSRPLDK
jgi:hypothetical protein